MNPIFQKAKNFLAGKTGNLIEKLGDAIDKNVTNKEEVMTLNNELQKIVNEYGAALENEITERWQADMASDNALSKNTRPIGFLSTLGFLFVVIILDSCNIKFDVKQGYIDLLEYLLITIVIAYYGSRGLEKYQSLRKK